VDLDLVRQEPIDMISTYQLASGGRNACPGLMLSLLGVCRLLQQKDFSVQRRLPLPNSLSLSRILMSGDACLQWSAGADVDRMKPLLRDHLISIFLYEAPIIRSRITMRIEPSRQAVFYVGHFEHAPA